MADEITITVEEGAMGLDPGDTTTGVVQDIRVKDVDVGGEDGEVEYFELAIEEDQSGIELTHDMPFRVTEGTQLGAILANMGADLTVGQDLTIGDYIAPGTRVAFEVGEEESQDGDRTFLRIEDNTIRPEDDADVDVQPAADASEDESSDELAGAKSNVLQLVEDEYEGDEAGDVKKALAKEDKTMLQAYKELVNEGELLVEDDLVFLA